jgi:ferredoxin
MRVHVDPDRCEGHGKCEAAAPEVFRLGDDDLSQVLVEDVPEALQAKVERAIQLCPRQAISWETPASS